MGTGVNRIRRCEMKLKARCVDCTIYEKIVHLNIVGNSMLRYAMASLDGVVVEKTGQSLPAYI